MEDNENIGLRESGFSVITRKLLDDIEDAEFEPDFRDTSHDLQTTQMKLCHADLERPEVEAIFHKLHLKSPDYLARDAHGRTVLMHACIAKRLDILEWSTAHAHDLTSRDNDGNTVLIYAIKSGDVELVSHVMNQSKSTCQLLTSTNNMGLSALDVARRGNSSDIVRLLEAHVPTHPNVKHLRKRNENRQPKLPPPAIPTAKRPTFSKSESSPPASPRIPFLQSKSLDFSITHSDISNTERCSGVKTSSKENICDSAQVQGIDKDVNTVQGTERKTISAQGLPSINTKPTTKTITKEGQGRRSSVTTSLPDLRDLRGNLVSSGTVTPVSVGNSVSSLAGDDEVFDDTSQNRGSIKHLPSIFPPSPKQKRENFARTRRKSNSVEDFVHRSLLF